MGTDHLDDFKLDEEQCARVKDCLSKDGVSLEPERLEQLFRKIERAVMEFPTPPPATFRKVHDALRNLWQLCQDDDPSPDQIRARIRNLPREAVDYLDQRAPQVIASLFPLEARDGPFHVWAVNAEREKLIEVIRAATEQAANVVRGRSRGNGNRLAALDADSIAQRITDILPLEKAQQIAATLNRSMGGDADAIASRILDTYGIEMARDTAMALQQRLMQGGCWPSWVTPMSR